jgi:hypothetical protein
MFHRPTHACLMAAVSIAALMLAVPASAQQEWQPFKDRSERALTERLKRGAKPASERVPEVRAPEATEPSPAQSTERTFTPPPKGAVERVELSPLDPLPQSQPGSTPPVTRPTLPTTSPVMPGVLPSADAPPQVEPKPRSALGALPQSTLSNLPPDLWRGLDMPALETLIQPLEVPPKSAALHALWQRLLTADATAPAGGRGQNHFAALQLEGLYRSGLIGPMEARLARTGKTDDALLTAFKIRRDLAAAETDAACAGVKAQTARRNGLPKALKGEAHILSGYCAVVAGNPAAAGLSADLAREEEVDAPLALQALDAIAAPQGSPKPKLTLPKRLMVLDYRLLEQVGPLDPAQVLANAEPALLYALSQTEGTTPKLAIAAAEAAAAQHALTPEQLTAVYARVQIPAGNDPLFRRAALFKSITAETQPQRRLTLARQLLDDARKSGLAIPMARALAVELVNVKPGPELGPLAATAAEITIAAGNYDLARQYAAASTDAAVWAPLAEIADPTLRGVSQSALTILDDAVRRNRFKPDQLHRLATVLDALDTNVPIPLWEAASRTPQPNTGYLPETGILPQLQEAAKKQELGRTALLVLRAIGPQGPDVAHLIALGDSIRALRRAGLDADARLLAMEALFAAWPRA